MSKTKVQNDGCTVYINTNQQKITYFQIRIKGFVSAQKLVHLSSVYSHNNMMFFPQRFSAYLCDSVLYFAEIMDQVCFFPPFSPF